MISKLNRFPSLLVCLLGWLLGSQAHSRWKCPSPRSPNTGIKTGPCGDQTNTFGESLIEIAPGPMRVEFEESIYHRGSPFRISLSSDASDDSVCVLLDHIPHNDNPPTRPNMNNEMSYVPYAITIEIPDIACERCSLHLANPMTDTIGVNGAPNGIGCTDPFGTCFSVYHSCTLPFRITGSASEWECPQPMPTDWPLQWIGDGGAPVPASVPGVYRREGGQWQDGLLQSVPERYREAVGVCASQSSTLAVPSTSPTVASGTTEESPTTRMPSMGPTTLLPSGMATVNGDTITREQPSHSSRRLACLAIPLCMISALWIMF